MKNGCRGEHRKRRTEARGSQIETTMGDSERLLVRCEKALQEAWKLREQFRLVKQARYDFE